MPQSNQTYPVIFTEPASNLYITYNDKFNHLSNFLLTLTLNFLKDDVYSYLNVFLSCCYYFELLFEIKMFKLGFFSQILQDLRSSQLFHCWFYSTEDLYCRPVR